MEQLSGRQERILEAVVVEYVAAAEPVPSDVIVRKYELGVRGATVRNEMAEITEMGLLEKPYTSAGRIPSDGGYRYFVDNIVVPAKPGKRDCGAIQGATKTEDTLYGFLSEATKALSRVTHLLSVAAVHRNPEAKVRHALVTGLGPEKCLFVLVLENGHVENRMVEAPRGADLAAIGQANDLLASECVGKTLRELASARLTSGPGDSLADAVATTLRSVAADLIRGKVVAEGHEFVLAQPEFLRDEETAHGVLESIEDEELLRSTMTTPGVSIGTEHADGRLHRLTVIRSPINVAGKEAGMMALIGPTRLDYNRSISILDYTARAIGKALDNLTA
jgi:heat-inducible transcriptional repressor